MMRRYRPNHSASYRFPGKVIRHAVWLSFRFPLSLSMVEEILAARSILGSGSSGNA